MGGHLERMGEGHELRAPIYQVCEGDIILWLTGWTPGSDAEILETGQGGSRAVTEESPEKSWWKETLLLRDSPPLHSVMQRPLGDGPSHI